MSMLSLAGAAGGALVLSVFVNAWLLRRAAPALLDHPNHRSLHDVPVPRGGGLGVVAGATIGAMVLVPGQPTWPLAWLALAALSVAGVSFVDDLRGLSPLTRLATQGAAALLLVAGGLAPAELRLPGYSVPLPLAVSAVLTVLFVVWMTNLYNFMDGMDGFAAGMGVFGFGSYALLGGLSGEPLLAGVSLCVVAGTLGFGLFNFPPARIFMGDVGASFLGLLAAGIALWADRLGAFPLWVGVLVFSPFVVDASVTLVRRLARGERVWQAHRSHYYQRIVCAGWTHRQTVLCEYLLMLLAAGSAVLATRVDASLQLALIGAWGVLYVALARVVSSIERAGNGNATGKTG